jgi:hypothetical protein
MDQTAESPRPLARDSRISGVVLLAGLSLLVFGLYLRGAGVASSARPDGAATGAHTSTVPPIVTGQAVGPNLLTNPALTGAAPGGIARGLDPWGTRPVFRVVPIAAASVRPRARHALHGEVETLAAGNTGGLWFTVAVRGGHAYVETIELDVLRLDPAAVVALAVEWYGPGTLYDSYVQVQVSRVTHGFRRFMLAGTAPAAARSARVVVKVVGGGTCVFTEPVFRALVPKRARPAASR